MNAIKTLIPSNPKFVRQLDNWDSYLQVAEFFSHTIQGEGINIGKPAVFLRMQSCTMNCVWCFHKNTKIQTLNNGKQKIQDIKEGDVLLTLDEKNGIVQTTVKKTMNRQANIRNDMVKIICDSDTLYVTKEHPIFVKDKGWTPAGQVEKGDVILSVTGKQVVSYSVVQEVSTSYTNAEFVSLFGNLQATETTVYNLECAPYNSYLANNMLVHNCDTASVWRQGNPYSFQELFELMEQHGTIDFLRDGASLVLTGGSPLLQQKELADFLDAFLLQYDFMPYVEVENECTLIPKELLPYVSCWNNSPKLSNSGNVTQLRYKPEVLKTLSRLQYSWFKFVIRNESDWQEIVRDFLEPGLIYKHQIILMPVGGSREELNKNAKTVVDIAIRNNVRYCSREHVQLWDTLTGV